MISTVPWGRDIPHSASPEAEKQNWAYWQNRINRASLVMLRETGILSEEEARMIAKAQTEAEKEQANLPPFSDIMPLEALLIKSCGEEATKIHTGRSRQDIFSTLNQARLRRDFLDFAKAFTEFREIVTETALKHTETCIPAYTNGVQAMPVTLGFYLAAYLESFCRDEARMESCWERINRSALGAAVLANSAYPLDRRRLAELLGFAGPVENSLDATQLSLFDVPLEAVSVAENVALRCSTLLADLAQQYAEVKPWILIDTGSTYGSSAMPQKRNPGLINKARAKAGDVIGAAATCVIRAHNLPLGMYDNKESASEDNAAVFVQAVHLMKLMTELFRLLRVHPERSLEELESDWTTSMALAETLQMKAGIPFRVGHTFCSKVVTEARKNGFIPKTFPIEAANRIYRAVTLDLLGKEEEFPFSEEEFRTFLSPGYVIRTRTGLGSPAPEYVQPELERLKRFAAESGERWKNEDAKLGEAERKLDGAFEKLL